MKYITLILLTFLLSCNNDDPTPNQSNIAFQISIQSQEDLENTNFDQIDTIKGPLTIRNTDITDFSFLSNICVTGIIEIFGNESLVSLNGIENLNCVSDLIISNNSNLKNIQALDGLEISKNLVIKNNALEEIEPIISLSTIEGQIFILEPTLKDYKLLRNLEEVNSLILGGSLTENLDELDNLKIINSDIRITGNQMLINYCGIKDALVNSTQINFETLGNQTNPTISDIIDECN